MKHKSMVNAADRIAAATKVDRCRNVDIRTNFKQELVTKPILLQVCIVITIEIYSQFFAKLVRTHNEAVPRQGKRMVKKIRSKKMMNMRELACKRRKKMETMDKVLHS